MVADLPSRVSLLSLSFCCPVRGEAEFPARSVVRSVTRSVPFLFFLRCAATTQATHPLRHFGKKKKKHKTNGLRGHNSNSHSVTSSHSPLARCSTRSFQLVCRSRPQAEALRSAVVSSRSNPTVLPILNFPTSILSLPSPPLSPAPIKPPTVDPGSAQSRCRLGSMETSFVELSQMIAAADSEVRSSPHLGSQRSAEHPRVLRRPRSVDGIAVRADSREPLSPQADSMEA